MIWINSFAEGSFYSSVVLHGGKVDSEAARYRRFEADPAHARARVAHLHRFRRHGPGINSVTPLRSFQRSRFKGLHDANYQFACVMSNNRLCVSALNHLQNGSLSLSHPLHQTKISLPYTQKRSHRPTSLERFLLFLIPFS